MSKWAIASQRTYPASSNLTIKSVINGKKPTKVKYNYRNVSVCLLDGNCQQNDVI